MIRVSIVEDIAVMRSTLRSIIEADSEMLCLSEHDNVEEAQKVLPLIQPDIVLIDINLNGENGIEVIRKVKAEKPSIQFLMCTVFQDDEKIFESLKAGASGYILKKSSAQEIRDSIKSLHEGGSPMTAEIARKVVE